MFETVCLVVLEENGAVTKHVVVDGPTGNVVHEVHQPQREKQVKQFIRSRWKPDGKVLEKMHLTLKADKAAKLKPVSMRKI